MSDRQRMPLDFGPTSKLYSWWDISSGMARSRISPFEVEIEHSSATRVKCATHIIQQSIPNCVKEEYMTPHIGIIMANDIVDCSLANKRRIDDLAYLYVDMESVTICRDQNRMYHFSSEKMETQIVPIGEKITPNYCAIFGKLVVSTPAFTFRPRCRIATDIASFECFREHLWDQVGNINIEGEEVIDGIIRLLSSTMPTTERQIHNTVNQLRHHVNNMQFNTSDYDHVALHEHMAMIKSGWYRLLEKIRFFKLNHYPVVQLIDGTY